MKTILDETNKMRRLMGLTLLNEQTINFDLNYFKTNPSGTIEANDYSIVGFNGVSGQSNLVDIAQGMPMDGGELNGTYTFIESEATMRKTDGEPVLEVDWGNGDGGQLGFK
tara:strand:- start:593 stop:925 length:333 start_codon:yes stop_codon:yes gene_type:complete